MIQLEERLYTSTEVAEILGVSLRSVYRYLDENKLDAEIKTATGRHRFSKKNIMDFLYPNGDVINQEIQKEIKKDKVKVNKETVEVKEETVKEVEEEPIDWLAKFREAAKKFKEEAEEKKAVETTVEQQEEVKPEPEVKYTEEPAFAQDKFSGFYGMKETREEVIEEKPAYKALFYRSALGGLKDIAQNIDKSARNAGVEYAFTLNAGLSLFKPIKPFSVLHAYVKTQDLPFFEKVLSLTPAEEGTAQLCLIVSSEAKVFNEKSELHGLFVVSKSKLMDDIQKMGDSVLTEEAKSVL